MTKVVRGGIAVSLLTVLCVTLAPSDGVESHEFQRCIVCGSPGLADAILNVLLFVPLGASLAAARVRWWHIGVGSALLSGAIECAQLMIPGRESSLGDILFNTTGAVMGWALAVAISGLVRRGRAPAAWERFLGAGILLTAVALTGYLLQPDFPRSTYYGQWTPHFGHMARYSGRVLDASVGGMPLPSDRVSRSAQARDLLLAGAPLRVRAVAGPRVAGLAPLFSIADDSHRRVMLLGVDGDALLFRYRTRAATWHLAQPDLRAVGALRGILAGDTLDVVVERESRGFCIAVDRTTTCGGFTAGTGWEVLLRLANAPPYVPGLLGALWLAALLVPGGYWARGGANLAALGLGAGATLLAVAPAVGLAGTTPLEWAGAATGCAVGWGLRRVVLDLEAPRASQPRAASPLVARTSSFRQRSMRS